MKDRLTVPLSDYLDKSNANHINKAYTALFVAVFVIGLLPILLRISEVTMSPSVAIFDRFWIATMILSIWNVGQWLLRKRKNLLTSSLFENWPNRQTFLLLLIQSIVFAGFQLLWAWSLTLTSVANSEVLHSLTPFFTVLLGWRLFGQQFDWVFLTGVTVALVGSVFLIMNDFSITIDKLTGDSLALLSAMFWALCLLLGEKLQQKMKVAVLTNWNCFLGSVFLIPLLLITNDAIFPDSFGEWLSLVILGVTVVCNQSLILYSLKWLSSSLVATILLLNPIISAVLAWFIFSEALSLINGLALVVILLGIYMVTLSTPQGEIGRD